MLYVGVLPRGVCCHDACERIHRRS